MKAPRKGPDLEREYARACATESDIHLHLPVLRRYAAACDHVTEMGSRTGASTRAFLCAQPKKFVAYDIQFAKPEPENEKGVRALIRLFEACRASGMDCEYHGQDVLAVEIEATDLLFIDTVHCYAQLARELALHAGKARRYLAFHDTVTFGEVGEDGTEGIRRAIDELLVREPAWSLVHESDENNGLIIIGRQPGPERRGSSTTPRRAPASRASRSAPGARLAPTVRPVEESAPLDPSTVLARLPELSLDLSTGEVVRIRRSGSVFEGGSHTLAVLDAFRRPRSIGDALEALKGRVQGAFDWVELMGTITALHGAGVLAEPGRADRFELARPQAFDQAPIHIAMLGDRGRTAAYLEAIARTVKTGDVVVDIGTGTGILAMAAARAGAARVWAIESGAMAGVAERLIAANGFAGIIRVVRGWSTQVQLPERADVLVSEIIGDDPFGESVFQSVADARARLLEPGARMVPRRLSVHAAPVAVSRATLGRMTFTKGLARRWRAWYGFDFDPLLGEAAPPVLSVGQFTARACAPLAGPVPLASVNLETMRELDLVATRMCAVRTPGLVTGLLVHFELDLAPGVTLSTAPSQIRGTTSWTTRVWLLPEPIAVRRGQRLAIHYAQGTGGSHLTCHAVAR